MLLKKELLTQSQPCQKWLSNNRFMGFIEFISAFPKGQTNEGNGMFFGFADHRFYAL